MQWNLLLWRPQGWMDHHSCLSTPRDLIDIDSEMFFFTSGIRTPTLEVFELQKVVLDAPSCVFQMQPLPFVVKLLRAGCGSRTFTVKTEAQRSNLLATLTTYKTRGTTDVIVSQYIDLFHDLSVHFVLGAPETSTKSGSSTIVSPWIVFINL